jgi:hypothetical protein
MLPGSPRLARLRRAPRLNKLTRALAKIRTENAALVPMPARAARVVAVR